MKKMILTAVLIALGASQASAELNMPTKRDRERAARRQTATFVTTQPAVQYVRESSDPGRPAHSLQTEDALYLDAIRLLQSGQYEAARAKLGELERVAVSSDLKAEAAAAIGDSYYEQGSLAPARESYERAIRLYPGNDQTEYIRGRLSQMGSAPRAELRPSGPVTASASAASRSSGGPLSVQVGAFKAQKNASKLVAQLNAKGYDAYIFRPDKQYRVRVGRLHKRADAMALAERLQKDGYPTRITG